MRTVTGYPGSSANMEITHLSLFSGIGGLDLAAEAAGCITIGQCEWAEYPTKVLEKHWPDVPRWRDIRTLTGESFYERTGRRTVDIISGGFPCQPFSVAGKQRGKEDDRYLWPEMVRVIKELRPTWIVGENVAGIVRMALPDILSELEACGYRTRTFLIPACAVGALHRRYRVAIVGYSEHNGLSSATQPGSAGKAGNREPEGKETAGQYPGTGKPGDSKNVAYPNSIRYTGAEAWESDNDPKWNHKTFEQSGRPKLYETVTGSKIIPNSLRTDGKGGGAFQSKTRGTQFTDGSCQDGGEWRAAKPGLGGMADGISCWMDGYWDIEPDIPRIAEGIQNRVGRLKALGNAVVPQQFFPVFKAIVTIEQAR